MSAVAAVVAQVAVEKVRSKKTVTIDVLSFQKSIENELQQTLDKFSNQVIAKFNYNEERIFLLEQAVKTLNITINDINHWSTATSEISSKEIFEIANKNTKIMFSHLSKTPNITKQLNPPLESGQDKIDRLIRRAKDSGMIFKFDPSQKFDIEKFEKEIAERENILKSYREEVQ